MSRVKIKQELIYFSKNIRKNKIERPEQISKFEVRPKTTQNKGYFASRGYRFMTNNKPQLGQSTLKTLQLNNQIYRKENLSPMRKNTKSFIQTVRIDKFKENKIKMNTKQGKIYINSQNNNMQQFIDALIDSNLFFQKLQKTMTESLTIIGSTKKYEKGQKFDLTKKNIGFLLYGRVKIYDQDYAFIANRGDTLGENQIFNHSKNYKVKIMQESAILWVPITSFNILRQQSVKQGFRQQFNKVQTQLRLNFIKKKMPKQ